MNVRTGRLLVLGIALAAGVALAGVAAPGAPSAPAPPPASIAVVNLEKVTAGLKEREDKEKELQRALDENQKKIDAMVEEAKADKAKYDNEPEGPTKVALLRSASEKLRRAEVERDFSARSMNDRTADMLREIYNKVVAAVQTVAKKDGYQLVLSNDESATVSKEGDARAVLQFAALKRVLYADPAIDITQRVVEEMNNAYAAGGGRAGAPAPAPGTNPPKAPGTPPTTAPGTPPKRP